MGKLIVGNWKMNGSLASNEALLTQLGEQLSMQGHLSSAAVEVGVCVPSVYLAQVALLKQNLPALQKFNLRLGAQDVSQHEVGAYTGEVSAAMLKELGVHLAIVGHSERRQYHGESDETVAQKAVRALAQGITPIVCVGETLQEREANLTMQVVHRQLAAVIHMCGVNIAKIVVAYEPVWAIGTGKTATPELAQAVHAALRAQLQAVGLPHAQHVPILYGGSMNAANASALLSQEDIDGGLIGGASLKAADFTAIVQSAIKIANA